MITNQFRVIGVVHSCLALCAHLGTTSNSNDNASCHPVLSDALVLWLTSMKEPVELDHELDASMRLFSRSQLQLFTCRNPKFCTVSSLVMLHIAMHPHTEPHCRAS